MKNEIKPETTFTESGRRGGQTTKERHGPEHYARIGNLGGSATAKKHGTSHFSRIGKLHGKGAAELPVPPNEAKALQKATGGAAKPEGLPAEIPDFIPGGKKGLPK